MGRYDKRHWTKVNGKLKPTLHKRAIDYACRVDPGVGWACGTGKAYMGWLAGYKAGRHWRGR